MTCIELRGQTKAQDVLTPHLMGIVPLDGVEMEERPGTWAADCWLHPRVNPATATLFLESLEQTWECRSCGAHGLFTYFD
jgi:hypothetical protein